MIEQLGEKMSLKEVHKILEQFYFLTKIAAIQFNVGHQSFSAACWRPGGGEQEQEQEEEEGEEQEVG